MPILPVARLAVLLFFLAGTLHAQTPTSSLTPVAQEALEKGVIAAKIPDYLLAIRYFEEARKLAPDAPAIYFNLGLAESKIPGRELRAMAWFGAYLAAYPSAPNETAVKEQIAVLDIRNQSNLARLNKTLQDTAAFIPFSWDRSNALLSLAEARIKTGDLAEAKNILNLALKSTELIDQEPSQIIQSSEVAKGQMLRRIASIQAESGDIAGARKTVRLMKDSRYSDDKATAEVIIAEVQARAGDIVGAQRTIDAITFVGDGYAKTWAQAAIAEAQIKAGDVAGAQNTNNAIQVALSRLVANSKECAQVGIAEAQAKAGDIAGAQKTIAGMESGMWKQHAQEQVAKVLTTVRPSVSGDLAANAAMPAPSVGQWIAQNDKLLSGAEFLDLSAHLNSLSSDNARRNWEGLNAVVSKIADARQVVIILLKQQPQQQRAK